MHPQLPHVLTREQVRDVDHRAIHQYGMTGLVLMENAGRNAASLLVQLGATGPVVICCGKGNNAGDGFVMARHLQNAGLEVCVLLSVPARDFQGDAAANYQILSRAEIPMIDSPDADLESAWYQKLATADWVVDALLGTGTQGTIREPFVSAISAINKSGRPVLAVDLPSGMDCDTGLPLGCCVQATHTATFVAQKPGFSSPAGKAAVGTVHVIDIGVPRKLLLELIPGTKSS